MQEFKTVEELLSDSNRWTKGYPARDAEDKQVIWQSEKACKWCLYGAVCKIYGEDFYEKDFIHKFIKMTGQCSIGEWNDSPYRTHKEVLDLVRRAGI